MAVLLSGNREKQVSQRQTELLQASPPCRASTPATHQGLHARPHTHLSSRATTTNCFTLAKYTPRPAGGATVPAGRAGASELARGEPRCAASCCFHCSIHHACLCLIPSHPGWFTRRPPRDSTHLCTPPQSCAGRTRGRRGGPRRPPARRTGRGPSGAAGARAAGAAPPSCTGRVKCRLGLRATLAPSRAAKACVCTPCTAGTAACQQPMQPPQRALTQACLDGRCPAWLWVASRRPAAASSSAAVPACALRWKAEASTDLAGDGLPPVSATCSDCSASKAAPVLFEECKKLSVGAVPAPGMPSSSKMLRACTVRLSPAGARLTCGAEPSANSCCCEEPRRAMAAAAGG